MNADADPDFFVTPGRPTRVLLCDDSNIERSALAQYLRSKGYDVNECDSGECALEHLKSHQVDVTLLDLQMPGTNGFDVLGYMQQHRRGVPVILLSGMPLDQIQHEIHSLPSQELPPLFLKPVDLSQLLHVLELQLSGELPDWQSATDAQDAAN